MQLLLHWAMCLLFHNTILPVLLFFTPSKKKTMSADVTWRFAVSSLVPLTLKKQNQHGFSAGYRFIDKVGTYCCLISFNGSTLHSTDGSGKSLTINSSPSWASVHLVGQPLVLVDPCQVNLWPCKWPKIHREINKDD